jgi:hypothetical protein
MQVLDITPSRGDVIVGRMLGSAAERKAGPGCTLHRWYWWNCQPMEVIAEAESSRPVPLQQCCQAIWQPVLPVAPWKQVMTPQHCGEVMAATLPVL